MEAANPFPSIGVMRVADAFGDGAGLDVAIVNVPAILAAIFGASAGKGRHGRRYINIRAGGAKSMVQRPCYH